MTSPRTDDLSRDAHCALVARQWRKATRALRQLAECQDNTRRMLSPEMYETVNRPLTEELKELFVRVNAIAAVNNP
jgi:hypothetical protein